MMNFRVTVKFEESDEERRDFATQEGAESFFYRYLEKVKEIGAKTESLREWGGPRAEMKFPRNSRYNLPEQCFVVWIEGIRPDDQLH